MNSWRWVRRTLATIAVGVVLTTVWLLAEREWTRSAGERVYAAAVAETERTDPDWRWDALNAKRVWPEPFQIEADRIPQVKALLPPDWGRTLDAKGPAGDRPANVRLPAATVAAARRAMDGTGPAVDHARTLMNGPAGNRRIDLKPNVLETPLPHLDALRDVVKVLEWDAELAVEDNQPGWARVDLLALLHASESVGDEPFLVSQMVRMGTRAVAARATARVLGQCELPVKAVAKLQAAWAEDAEEPLLLYGLRGERAVNDVLFANILDGTDRPPAEARAAGPDRWFGSYSWWLHRVRLYRDRAFLHDYFGRAVAVARLPLHKQAAALAALPPPPGDDLRMAQLFLPAVEKAAWAQWRSAAEARCVVVGLACERFRLARGRWPATLDELPKELLAAVPLDPFDGRPLRFRKFDDGVVVYSVGENRADDGGTLPRSVTDRPDEGFRLWDPAARGRPAPPDPPAEPVHNPEPE